MSPDEQTTKPLPRLQTYFCQSCRATLGMTSAGMLFIGQAGFKDPVTFQCQRCKATNLWKPLKPDSVE